MEKLVTLHKDWPPPRKKISPRYSFQGVKTDDAPVSVARKLVKRKLKQVRSRDILSRL